MNTALAFEVVLQGLRLWNTKEANALINKVFELRTQWELEYNKPVIHKEVVDDFEKYRNNRKLDSLGLQLDLIARTYVVESKK